MPRYDYHCSTCGKTVEVSHSIRQNPAITCEECSLPMVRLISGGDAVAVEKGTLPSNVQKAVDAKAARDMDHARKTEKWVKEVGQPKTRAGLNRPWPKPPKE